MHSKAQMEACILAADLLPKSTQLSFICNVAEGSMAAPAAELAYDVAGCYRASETHST